MASTTDLPISNVSDGISMNTSSTITEVPWRGTEWVTEYANQTVNVTECPIYVQKVHILPNPWDDATWILTSAFVIFTMQSGFGLLESGTATVKNEVNIMVKNAVDVIFGGIAYWTVGYAFSFGDSEHSNAFSGWGKFFLTVGLNVTSNDTIGWEYSNFIFQLAFATTATTIVSGAMVERTRLEAYIVFSLFNTMIYSFPSHWVWGKHGFLKELGVLDIAGAGPVHIAGGTTGFVATLVLRPRHRRYKTNTPPPMGSPTNALLGMFMLWWGWLGFNCGSTHGITSSKWALAARSAVATICSSMAGGMMGITLSYISKRRKFDIGYLINGVLGSLVSITASCTICPPKYSLLIGAIGGAIACGGIELLIKLHVDDPVGVVPVHFMCGIWSLLSAGLFAEKEPAIKLSYSGLFMGGGGYLLGVQMAAVVCIVLWCAVLSFLVLQVIDLLVGLRFPFQEELLGADIVEHSIGPRKYDKIKKRLTDVSRARGYNLHRRKKISASFRAAETYLSQQDAGIHSVSENIDVLPMTQKFRKKGKHVRTTLPYPKKSGQRNAECYPTTNGNDLTDFSHDGGLTGKSPRIKRRTSSQNSMRRLHGALRRRRISRVPKWQKQLGVDNLGYLQKDERSDAVDTDQVFEQNSENGTGSDTKSYLRTRHDPEQDTEPEVIHVLPKRRIMVDNSTQTSYYFEQKINKTKYQAEFMHRQEDDGIGIKSNMNLQFVTSVEFTQQNTSATFKGKYDNIIIDDSDIISEEYMV